MSTLTSKKLSLEAACAMTALLALDDIEAGRIESAKKMLSYLVDERFGQMEEMRAEVRRRLARPAHETSESPAYVHQLVETLVLISSNKSRMTAYQLSAAAAIGLCRPSEKATGGITPCFPSGRVCDARADTGVCEHTNVLKAVEWHCLRCDEPLLNAQTPCPKCNPPKFERGSIS